jgi:hypothetical protein
MDGSEIIAILAIFLCIGGAIFYIVKAKKSGQKCIGCPHGGKCASKEQGCNGCSCSCGTCGGHGNEEIDTTTSFDEE